MKLEPGKPFSGERPAWLVFPHFSLYNYSMMKVTDRQKAKNKGKITSELLLPLLVSFCIIGFLWGWTVLNKKGSNIFPAAKARSSPEFIPANESAMIADKTDEWAIKDSFAQRHVLQPEMRLKVPLILQNPELPRGCEVTCLAMLLQYAGVPVDKMTLAEEIKKDPTPYQIKKGKIYFGDPYYGFVGNMYTLRQPGYGVYHGPVRELLEKYMPGCTIDLTGCAFEDILLFISEGVPVWAVANATFAPLTAREFQTWHTPQGPVEISYREHAVLLTGYDAQYVYFNDPLSSRKNKRADRAKFTAAWEQMGCQAVSYLPY